MAIRCQSGHTKTGRCDKGDSGGLHVFHLVAKGCKGLSDNYRNTISHDEGLLLGTNQEHHRSQTTRSVVTCGDWVQRWCRSAEFMGSFFEMKFFYCSDTMFSGSLFRVN